MPLHFDAITFDLGDTITDLGEGRGDYEARVLARAGKVHDLLLAHGIDLPERAGFCEWLAEGSERLYQEALRSHRGLDAAEALARLFAESDLPVSDRLLAGCVEAYCRPGLSPVPLRRGAAEVLAALKDAGLRLGVISNTIQPGRYLDESLQRQGLDHFFDARIYSSEIGIAKPHPGIFAAALAALDTTPAQALHVGDRLQADVYGAQQAGMRAVLIRVPGRLEESAEITPDAVINELPELLEVLHELVA